jgi:hypothetical protein
MKTKKQSSAVEAQENYFSGVSVGQVFEYKRTLYMRLDSNFNTRYFSIFNENQQCGGGTEDGPPDYHNEEDDAYDDESNVKCTKDDSEENETYKADARFIISTHRFNAIRLSVLSEETDKRDRLVKFESDDRVKNINSYTLVHDSFLA